MFAIASENQKSLFWKFIAKRFA